MSSVILKTESLKQINNNRPVADLRSNMNTTNFCGEPAINSSDILTIPCVVSWTTEFDDFSSTQAVIRTSKSSPGVLFQKAVVQICLYGIIFILTIVGNALVILTLAQIRRMRTVTNIFLLNLAVADILIGVFCMPFTLVGATLRNFIFGEVMCKLIPYLQACSVAVGAWTLVAISVERYYAICHPLRSLSWQTLSHAYKTVVVIWLLSLFCALPIAVLSELQPTNEGKKKCRESWPTSELERAYNLFLIISMMVVPLIILIGAYYCIIKALCKTMEIEHSVEEEKENISLHTYVHIHCSRSHKMQWSTRNRSSLTTGPNLRAPRTFSGELGRPALSRYQKPHTGLRRTNAHRSNQNKRRVIWMLVVVVLEFFICWSPLYITNTIVLFDQQFVYQKIGYKAVSLLQLLAYTSSCCNPITYCFMNYSFRKSLYQLFQCEKHRRKTDEMMLVDIKVSNRCSSNNTA